jgi:hypothetical protein
MTKKIYVVTSGEYSDYSIEAVFSTKELAGEYVSYGEKINLFGYTGAEIEEFDLDISFPKYPKDKAHWSITLDLKTGKTIYVMKSNNQLDKNLFYQSYHNIFTGDELLDIYCWAKDEEHAKKIAFDIRTKVLAERANL